jgi:phosphoglycolate phosphatase-like HAD superfamily hydrolase
MSQTKESESLDAGFHPSSFELPLYPEKEPAGRIKNVVFDWYGTIYNCMPLFPVVFSEEMYKRFQIPRELAYRNFRLNKGLSIPEQIKDLLGSERYDKYDTSVIESTRSALYNRLDDLEADIFEDVPGGLFKLLRSGYTLSVLSHNKESSLRKQIQEKGLTGFFKFVVGRNSCEECQDKGEGFVYLSELHGKSYGDFISETAFVTDTTVDVKRSTLMGVSVIARSGVVPPQSGVIGRGRAKAIWDYERSSLYNAKAKWVVTDFKNLDAIIRTM